MKQRAVCDERASVEPGESNRSASGTSGRTDEPSQRSGDTDWRKARITCSGIKKLVEQQNYRCHYTGRQLEPEDAALDHTIPLKQGGEHTLANVQVVHHEVNNAKGTMSAQEFIDLCCEVALHKRGIR